MPLRPATPSFTTTLCDPQAFTCRGSKTSPGTREQEKLLRRKEGRKEEEGGSGRRKEEEGGRREENGGRGGGRREDGGEEKKVRSEGHISGICVKGGLRSGKSVINAVAPAERTA